MNRYYPSEEELNEIIELDNKQDVDVLLDYVKSMWEYSESGFKDKIDCDAFKRNKRYIELHTSGWSGNEEIIGKLMETKFWFFYWQKSERGGHYYFEIPITKETK